MKKLKPIHYVLIGILILEIIACAWIFLRPTPDTLPSDTELILTYERVDNAYAISSVFKDAEMSTFNFADATQELVFDGNVVDMVEMYQNIERFAQRYPNASAEAWTAYKTAAEEYLYQQMGQQHASFDYIKSVATKWYNVEPQTTLNNKGFYAMHATSTLNEWIPLFSEYQIEGYDKILDEMALSAVLQIGETQHPALVYMRVVADGDTTNNDVAQEVSISILFGDTFLENLNATEATLYFMRPDGSEYFAHSNLTITFLADTIESYYRTFNKIVGG